MTKDKAYWHQQVEAYRVASLLARTQSWRNHYRRMMLAAQRMLDAVVT